MEAPEKADGASPESIASQLLGMIRSRQARGDTGLTSPSYGSSLVAATTGEQHAPQPSWGSAGALQPPYSDMTPGAVKLSSSGRFSTGGTSDLASIGAGTPYGSSLRMGDGLGSLRFSELGASIRMGDAADSLRVSDLETDPMEVAALVQEMDAYFPSDMALGDFDTFSTEFGDANALDGLLDPTTLDEFKGLLDSLGDGSMRMRESGTDQKPGMALHDAPGDAYQASNANSMNVSYAGSLPENCAPVPQSVDYSFQAPLGGSHGSAAAPVMTGEMGVSSRAGAEVPALLQMAVPMAPSAGGQGPPQVNVGPFSGQAAMPALGSAVHGSSACTARPLGPAPRESPGQRTGVPQAYPSPARAAQGPGFQGLVLPPEAYLRPSRASTSDSGGSPSTSNHSGGSPSVSAATLEHAPGSPGPSSTLRAEGPGGVRGASPEAAGSGRGMGFAQGQHLWKQVNSQGSADLSHLVQHSQIGAAGSKAPGAYPQHPQGTDVASPAAREGGMGARPSMPAAQGAGASHEVATTAALSDTLGASEEARNLSLRSQFRLKQQQQQQEQQGGHTPAGSMTSPGHTRSPLAPMTPPVSSHSPAAAYSQGREGVLPGSGKGGAVAALPQLPLPPGAMPAGGRMPMAGPANDAMGGIEQGQGQGGDLGVAALNNINWGVNESFRPVNTLMEQLLMRCAIAIDQRNLPEAQAIMTAIFPMVSKHGSAEQRLGFYFLEGLAARVVGTGSAIYKELQSKQGQKPGLGSKEMLTATLVFIEACPWINFGHVAANGSILEAVEEATEVHIIDFGITHGTQWPTLIEQLAVRQGGPPKLRITGIDAPQTGLKPSSIQETGRRLASFARVMGVPFEFSSVTQHLNSLQAESFEIRAGEVVVVNCMLRLHQLPDDSAAAGEPSPRNFTLQLIHSLRPKIVTLVEQSAEHNIPSFIVRFRESLHYMAGHFEALDMALPWNSTERAIVEERVMGRKIINMVACEGRDRVERHESNRRWQDRMLNCGFQPRPISADVLDSVQMMLRRYHGLYGLLQADHALLLTWKGHEFFAASTWVC